jgi:hypothetical protein
MSAPQTDIERQKRRHVVPLIGIGAVTLFAVLLIVYWLFEEVAASDPPSQEDEIEAPVSTTPPEAVTPAPAVDPGTQPAPLTPEPAPQDAPDEAPAP